MYYLLNYRSCIQKAVKAYVWKSGVDISAPGIA